MPPRCRIRQRRIIVEVRERSISLFENERAMQLGDARHQAQVAISTALGAGRGGGIEGGPVDVGPVGY